MEEDAYGVDTAAAGLAALSVCESLLLALLDLKVIDASEHKGLLRDALRAHQDAVSLSTNPDIHRAASRILQRLLDGRGAAL